MKPTHILTDCQKTFLDLLSQSELVKHFYLTGGTALVGFYLPYRLSEDLDFFSEEEFEIQMAVSFIKSIKNKLKYKEIDINTSFNRNLIFLKFRDFVLKIEFTYFPFTRIEKSTHYKKVKVDSLLDIAVNKLFTIYQKPRSRDYTDLYIICKENNWSIKELTKMAKIKFDWYIDPIKLGAQFLRCRELKDYPHLLVDLKEEDWQNFFLSEAKKLKKNILS